MLWDKWKSILLALGGPPENLLALALTNMGWIWGSCWQARTSLGWEWFREQNFLMESTVQIYFRGFRNVNSESIWPVKGSLWYICYMGFPKFIQLLYIFTKNINQCIHQDSLLSIFWGTEITTNLLLYTLFLFCRSSVASNPMRSSFSPTQMAWSFWCAMKMKGFMWIPMEESPRMWSCSGGRCQHL